MTNKLDEIETKLREIETLRKVIEDSQQMFAAPRVQIVNDLVDSGLLSVKDMRRLLGFPNYNIETRVQVIKVDGREVLEWVV